MEQTKQHKRAEDINVSYEEALNIAPKKIKREDSAQRDTSTMTRRKITNEDLIEGIFIACMVALLAFGIACLIQMMRIPLSISIIN